MGVRAVDILRVPASERQVLDERGMMERYLAGAKKRSTLTRKAFMLLVVLPTAIASFYYGIWASDRYVSEARFIVRGISSPRTSGLDMFFQTFGISRAVDDTNAVQNYMLSRDAVRALQAKLPLRDMFSREEGDMFARFPHFWRGDSFETLYEYYKERVSVIQDPSRGITELKVSAFRPEDSLALAQALVGLAEEMVNRMNARAQNDAMTAAETEAKEAEQRLLASEADLTEFRNRELVVDPAKNSVSVVETITGLSKELAATLAQIQQFKTTSPNNPAVRVWQAKSEALKSQIAAERAKLGGNANAFGAKVSAYERLTLTRDIAEKSLTSAEASLELARQEARRQQIYIEEITKPNLADKSMDPERLRMIATVFTLCFGVFSIVWILFVGAREHAH
jgi:capsular polysaccharide transport system permease protein